jgi:UDPglucose 6-dehydrogenase
MYKLGIIGRGFVGSAVAQGFSQGVGYNAEIRIYDKEPLKSNDSLEDVVKLSEIIFISVPTPSNKDGSINLDILEECLEEINEIANKTNSFDNIYLIRSTVTPGTTRNFQEKFSNLRFVFNPEFLTERSANFDFISQTRFVLGGDQENVKKISSLYRDRFGSTVSIIETDYESAELIKYVCNTFFATKVSFLNEMKLLSESVNANWQDVMEGFLRDGRVGNSHSQVPGPDGKLGFGGSCFPKDIQALINFGSERNINLSVLKGAWETNKLVRPEKDWESLVGRSVVDNKIEE